MCIRDRGLGEQYILEIQRASHLDETHQFQSGQTAALYSNCLLYTSDAADERSSVDLGGRRIIKKKITRHTIGTTIHNYTTTACTEHI